MDSQKSEDVFVSACVYVCFVVSRACASVSMCVLVEESEGETTLPTSRLHHRLQSLSALPVRRW